MSLGHVIYSAVTIVNNVCVRVCVCVNAQSCLILCDPLDCSLPGSSVYGILQARTLEWVVISSSRGFYHTQGSNLRLLHLPHWQADSLPLSTTWEAHKYSNSVI